jgi:type I restriction enzyme S subunit
MRNSFDREPIRQLLETIVDNRGMTVPPADHGIPLIATNCIKETSLYPTFENIRYVSEETHRTWFRAHLQPDDILFVNKGTPGRVCMVPNPVSFCAAQDMIGLRADRSKVYPRYLFAFLRSDWVKEKIRNYHVGLVIPHFKKQDLDSITVPKRPYDEQKAIGDLYFLLSEKIELNQRINAELEGMAKLLYDYWFVQFDFPMTAAQAAALGKPKLAGHPYRASGGKMIFCPELKRNIPEAWKVGDMSELCSTVRGVTYSKADVRSSTDENTIPILRATNVNNGVVDLSDLVFVTDDMPSEDQFLDKFDILIVMSSGSKAHVGKNALYCHDRKVAYGAFCSKIVPREACRFFVSVHLQTDSFKKYISNVCLGTNINNLTNGHITGHRLVIPQQAQLLAFENTVTSFFEKIACNHQQNQELTQLRDWLLPMLMNGQVTVG